MRRSRVGPIMLIKTKAQTALKNQGNAGKGAASTCTHSVWRNTTVLSGKYLAQTL